VLANVALSVLDEFVAQTPGGTSSTPSQRATRRRKGQANYRLVRYADDWLVSGAREHAEDMRTRAATVLAPMGLRLSEEKTKITHIDEGLELLAWRIQRHRKRGTNRHYVYAYPSCEALHGLVVQRWWCDAVIGEKPRGTCLAVSSPSGLASPTGGLKRGIRYESRRQPDSPVHIPADAASVDACPCG
jgi:hypothetical protein